MKISTPEPNTQYSLDPITNADAVAYKVVNDKDKNEYYVLENRQLTGWDAHLPSHGLQVTHVTFNQVAWDSNTVNNYDLQRMTIIPADGKLLMSGGAASEADMKGDLYPYNGNNQLTDKSSPAAKVNTGTYMSKPITEITETNGKVSFWFMKEAMQKTSPVLTEATDVTSNSFTAHWTAGKNAKSYTLYVYNADKVQPATLLSESDFTGGLPTGWTASSTGTYEDNGYFRLGTAKAKGHVISPKVNVTDNQGTTTVKITAKPWSTDESVTMRVSVLDSVGATKSTSDVILDSETDKEYVMVLNGGANNAQIKIESIANRKRVMLKTVQIYSGNAADMMAAAETGDADTRTITGITDTLYTVKDLTPGANYNYKVKALYLDDTECEWSEAKSVKLLGGGIVGDVNGDGELNASDVTVLVNRLLGTEDKAEYTYDINGDSKIDVSDVTTVINLIQQAN